MSSWREIRLEEVGSNQLLDCMWVMIYKFDKQGYLIKAKARLVVRRDQQASQVGVDNYASTLAGRSFRSLMVIAARFNLELIQYDVVNAFVHATLPKPLYMKSPPSFKKTGIALQLLKALYGLRESPFLWQKEISSTLIKLGYKKVPYEPCCYTKEGVIIFFYVDDIVVAYRKDKEATATTMEDLEALKAVY